MPASCLLIETLYLPQSGQIDNSGLQRYVLQPHISSPTQLLYDQRPKLRIRGPQPIVSECYLNTVHSSSPSKRFELQSLLEGLRQHAFDLRLNLLEDLREERENVRLRPLVLNHRHQVVRVLNLPFACHQRQDNHAVRDHTIFKSRWVSEPSS